MTALPATLLSIVMLAIFALTGGGIYLLLRQRDRKRGVLMLVAAAVFLVNVLLWTRPG